MTERVPESVIIYYQIAKLIILMPCHSSCQWAPGIELRPTLFRPSMNEDAGIFSPLLCPRLFPQPC